MVTQRSYRAGNRTGGRTGGRTRYVPRRKVCSFCVNKVKVIDYKDVSKLHRYVSVRGKIEPSRRTGVCAKHQRALAVAIKRGRHLALLPYVSAHVYKPGDVDTSD